MTINVAIYLDEKYAPHATVMVRSLLENMAADENLCLFVLNIDLPSQLKNKMQSNWKNHNLIVNWIDLGTLCGNQKLTPVSYLSGAAYLRLYIGKCLPETIDRVITIDCDGVVLGNIGNLWKYAPREYCLMAVQDPCVPRLADDHSTFLNSIQVNRRALYFNSGLMVINLKLWRELQISEKSLELCQRFEGQGLYADQSFLNAVLQGAWEKLPLSWNCSKRHLLMHYYPSMRDQIYSCSEVREALRRPNFLHFISAVKPWAQNQFHLDRNPYFHYLNMTNWKEEESMNVSNLNSRKEANSQKLYFHQTQNLRRKFGFPPKLFPDIVHLIKSFVIPY